jgi:Ca-activated chloride channel family protein
MRFLWPQLLYLLLALPLLVAVYIHVLRRRKRAAVLYPSLALARAAIGPGQRLRRHVPPALFLLSLAAALIACARPVATVTLPTDTLTIVLAMDVSRSMEAGDVQPSRIAAAEQAAHNFVGELPSSVRLGIVSFAATATVVQSPTDNRQDMLDAIDRFQLQRGTATGSGLIMALSLLFPDDREDLQAMLLNDPWSRFGFGPTTGALGSAAAAEAARKREQERPAVEPGSYTNGAIILLTDGRRTMGPDPIDIARMAARRGVRVYTVGFGTRDGGMIGGEGLSYWMQIDEPTLRAVAKITGGEYYAASSANDLKQIYRKLSSRIALERKNTELGGLFAAVSAALLALACVLSMLWFRR